MKNKLLLGALVCLLAFSGCSAKHANPVALAREAVQDTKYMRAPDAEAAIKQDPNNALAHQRLGEALEGHNSLKAIDELRTTIRLQPDNRQAMFELAYELKHTGDLPAAKILYSQLAMQNDVWGRSARRKLLNIK